MDPKQTAHGDRSYGREDPRFWGFEKLPDNHTSRPTDRHEITIRFHHAGIFVSDPLPEYVRGEIYEMEYGLDIDEISGIELGKILKSIGYCVYKCLWYRHPDLDLAHGLRPLNTDKDVIRFINDVKGHTKVDCYVEHLIDNPVYGVEEADSSDVEIVENPTGGGGHSESEDDYSDFEYVGEGVAGEGVAVAAGEGVAAASEGVPGEGVAAAGEGDAGEGVTDEEDEDEDSLDDVSLDDSDYEEEFDWTSVLSAETLNPTSRPVGSASVDFEFEGVGGSVGAATSSRNPDPTTVADFEDEDGDSEELDSPPSSEEEVAHKRKYPKFKLGDEEVQVNFELGQIFTSADLVKAAVREYALQARKNVYLAKNDKKRIVVKCMSGCSFYMRVSKSTAQTFYQIARLESSHTCHRTAQNRQAKTKWLAKKFITMLRHTPNMKVKALQEEAKNRWGIILSRFKCYRAQRMALEIIEGATSEQYKHLRSYAAELVRSNPNSTVIIKSVLGVKGPVFQRIYVCFNACKMAFVNNCRPLIGLDGCFLKGVYGGQLLSAIGKDGNNQMFPIAFAVVEAETRDSWSWFINLLLHDLNRIEKKNWAFISDQQKGLVPTLQSMDEEVEHRLCVKHLYGNWRKRYPEMLMKEALWSCARSNTMADFRRNMDKLKKLNESAWKDMCELEPSMWTRAAYSTNTLCDLQVNNMCEAFNRAILEYRDKPIISLIEGLKFYLTNRIVKQKDLMLRYTGNICPMIQQKLEQIKRESDKWSPMWSGDATYALFEVSNGTDKYVVNLTDKSCSCRRWDLSGIPCCHAISCMWYNSQAPEEFVHPCYRKSTFLNTYDHIILPCNGPKLWPDIDVEPLNPPYMRRAPGRPKKQRRKENDEPRHPKKMRRQQPTIKCRRCGELGHNKRTCIGKTTADRAIPKGGNKTHTQVQQPDEGTSQQASQATQAPQATQPSQPPQAT